MPSFRINRVYTRSGDGGNTGLVGGNRVSKANLRIAAFGEIDELNSLLGYVKEKLSLQTKELFPLLEFLQQELFDLGSQLATPPESIYEGMWQAAPNHVERLEKLCDEYGAALPELTSFILPGGSEIAALFHLARSVARRAERTIVALGEQEKAVDEKSNAAEHELLKYVNRLSDLFFILARWSLVKDGKEAPLWVQERNRKLPNV